MKIIKSIIRFFADMPCPCEVCGEWFDLNDGKEHPRNENLIICASCSNAIQIEVDREEEIEELRNTIDDAECTIRDAKARLIELETKHGFCETQDSNCTMNYCDENGCNDRKRSLVPPKSEQRESERPDIRNFSCYNDYNKALTEWLNQDHLKPCPFCGGQAEIKQTGKSKMKIFCKSCHFGLQQRVLRLSMEWLEKTLRNSWNMRVRPIDDLSIERHLVNIKNTQLGLMKKEIDRLKDDLFTVADPDHPEYESIKERYK